MNIALIGLGMVADTHVAAIADIEGLHLHGVLARDPGRTATFAATRGTQIYATVEQIAQDPGVDFVILATPPDARQEFAHILAAAGKPTLMEKPIERTLGAATQIVALFEAANTPLGVVFQHRARQASIALKSALTQDILGEIASVELRVPWWRDQSYYDAPGRGTFSRDGGGVMISQAIHTLDLALWLAGPVAELQALMHKTPMHQLEAEDWAGALLTFQSGAVGTLTASTAAFPGTAESITMHCTKGTAHLASGTLTLTMHNGRHEKVGAPAPTGGGADPMAFTHDWHAAVISNFADSLTHDRPPMTTGREALRAHAVIDAMQTAQTTGHRTKVSTP